MLVQHLIEGREEEEEPKEEESAGKTQHGAKFSDFFELVKSLDISVEILSKINPKSIR